MPNQKKIFGDIYDRYVDKIYRFIFLKIGTQEVAEDLTSEVFTRLWKKMKDGGAVIENLNAFLYQVARNLVADHYRAKGAVKMVSADNLEILDPLANPQEQAINKSDTEMLKTVLANLKDDYREAVVWYYIDDISVPDIAKMTNKSEEAVRVTIHRGLKALKEEMAQYSATPSLIPEGPV